MYVIHRKKKGELARRERDIQKEGEGEKGLCLGKGFKVVCFEVYTYICAHVLCACV